MDKRRQKGEKTRQAILTATETILDQKGGNALSTRAIAQQAGICQSSLYHHFKGLEDILLACLVDKAKQSLEMETVNKFDNLLDYLDSQFRMSVDTLQSLQHLAFTIREKALHDETIRLKLADSGQSFIESLKSNIRQKHGDHLDEERLELIVFAFTMFRDGYVAHRQLFKDQSPFGKTSAKTRSFLQMLNQYLDESGGKQPAWFEG